MKLQTPLFFIVLFCITDEALFASDSRAKRDVISDWLQSFIPLGNRGFSFAIQIPDFEAYSRQLSRSIEETGELTHSWLSVKWYQGFGVLLGLWGIYLQHCCHVILANLRKNSNGSVVTYQHRLPSGGWFEWVSCPHYFAEIVIYLAMNIMLGGHCINWWLVCLWVLCNQVLAAIMSHHWYKSKFKEYPKTRRAIVPFIL